MQKGYSFSEIAKLVEQNQSNISELKTSVQGNTNGLQHVTEQLSEHKTTKNPHSITSEILGFIFSVSSSLNEGSITLPSKPDPMTIQWGYDTESDGITTLNTEYKKRHSVVVATGANGTCNVIERTLGSFTTEGTATGWFWISIGI